MNRLFSFLSMLFFVFCLCTAAFAASGTAGEIRIVVNDGEIIRFSVYDVEVKGMKGKQVTFGFEVSQDGEWLDASWLTVDMGVVEFDPCYWNDEACWFQYNVQELIDAGGKPFADFSGSFFIINTANDKTIARKDITFGIGGGDMGTNMDLNDYSTDVSDAYSASALTIEVFPAENEVTISADTYDRVSRDIIAELTFELNLYKGGKQINAGLTIDGSEGITQIFGWSHAFKLKRKNLGKGTFKAEISVKDADGNVLVQKTKEFDL